MLGEVASTLKKNLRKTDVAGRLGGDEFAIVFCNTNESHAIKGVDKLRLELNLSMSHRLWPVSFSVGVGIFNDCPTSE